MSQTDTQMERAQELLVVGTNGMNYVKFRKPQGIYRKDHVASGDYTLFVVDQDGNEERFLNGAVLFFGDPDVLPDPDALREEHKRLDGTDRWGYE